MIQTTMVAKEFSDFLINRDKDQGDGSHTGEEFRKRFLASADSQEWWDKLSSTIALDFSEVDTIGPSWANEVFAYFTKYKADEKQILGRFKLQNISSVKLALIKREIESGYKV